MPSASRNVYASVSSSYPYTMSVSWSESNASVTNNTSVISASGSFGADKISFDSWQTYYLRLYWHDNNNNTDTLFATSGGFTSAGMSYGTRSVSGSITVSHRSDGSLSGYVKLRFDAPGTCGGYSPGTTDCSTDWTGCTTIARASSISGLSGSQLGSSVSVTIDRKSSGFTHKVEYSYAGSGWSTASSNAETSASFTPPVSLSSQVTNGTSGALTVRVTTYNGSTQIGSSATKSIILNIPNSVVPSLSSVTANRVDNGVPSGWSLYVKGISQVKISASGASGSYGSTIQSYSISGPGLNTNASSGTSSVLSSTGTLTYTCTVTDTRGRSASKSVSISVVDYYTPSVSVTAVRCDSKGTENANGTYLKVTVTYSCASVSSKNSISSKSVTCNSVSNTSFSSCVAFILSSNCSIGSQYTLTASVTDALGETASANVVIPTAYRIINVNKNKKGIAFGKFSEKDAFEVNMDEHVYGDEYISKSSSIGKTLSIGNVSREGYTVRNSNGSLTWIKLGTMNYTSDDNNTIVKIYSGAGYNAGTNQNTEIDIFVKDGWQSSLSSTNAFAGTFCMPYNVDNGVKVLLIAWSNSIFDIYLYLPWTYYNFYYTIEYVKGARWDHQGTRTNSTSTPSPSGGVVQPCANVTPDLKGYPVGAIYLTYNNNNPGNFLGGTWVQFGQGRTLIGEGTGNDGSTSMSFATNSTGGNYKKTLTRDEIPMYNIGQFPSAVPINHSDWDDKGIYGAVLGKVPIGKHGIKSCADNTFEGDDTTMQYGWRITSNGGGRSFDISQPYIVVTFWKRIS